MAPKRRRAAVKSVEFEDDREAESGNDEDEERQSAHGDEGFNLHDVLRLGGTRADYAMLLSVKDTDELIDGGKKDSIDDLKKDELEDFITKLGIRAYNPLQVVEEEPGEQKKDGGKKVVKKTTTTEQNWTVTGKAQTDLQNETCAGTKNQKGKTKKSKEISTGEIPGKKSKTNASVFDFQPRQTLLIKPGGKWFELEYTNESDGTPQDMSVIAQYKCLAQKLFEAETEFFKSKNHMKKGANSTWMKTVVSTGTLADRMAAMTLLIQDAPVHNLQFVESLVSLIRKKGGGRRQSLMALDTLRELLVSDLLPENRKLRTFSQHPFSDLEKLSSGNRDARDRRLILWYFEHQLKHQVAEFVVALESLSHDTVTDTKAQALTTAHELLCNRPEQEKALLTQVVNKLGDPEYKMAAKASYLLDVLLHKHPVMKAVVCSEVERLMFRPNVSPKAQYYAVCFLNQMVLSHDEANLASRLITIYFSFFRACIKNREIESKLLSALLSGVNRAYPYAEVGDDKIREQLDTLFKVVHLVKFNTAVQALMLLFQVMNSQQTISDRYYIALYRKLLDPGLSRCSRQGMFLNLLYKSLKSDIVLRRVKAFVKRLLQVSCELNPTFACGALFLVSEVMKAKPGLKVLLQDSGDDEEEMFKDVLNDDDEEERFMDADKVEEGQNDQPEKPKEMASWVHYQNLEGGKTLETYDPLHRNPLFCGADHTTLWELQKLSAHFHPSVALFAKTILKGDFIQYTGDPLQDFTLIRFLDRFVFRNPKQQKVRENIDSTVMQAKQKVSMSSSRLLPVNSEEFLAKEESQIPVDEVFFYRFFKRREKERSRFQRRDRDDESVEDVDDDEFERALDSFESDSYFTDLKDNDLDFAGNVKGKKKNTKRRTEEEEDDSDLDEDDLDDEEVSLGSMDEEDFGDELEEDGGTFMDLGGEEDEELAGSEDEKDAVSEMSKGFEKGRKKKIEELDFAGSLGTQSSRKKKSRSNDDNTMLATAEEFGYLLDENAGSKFNNIGMDALANKDKASLKQLRWEAQRDDWLHGRDAKTLRRKKAAFQRRKQFGKMRTKMRKRSSC